MPDLTGKMIDRYLVQEQIGSGGMSVVYKAYDTRLERSVALKVVLPHFQQTEAFLRRFKREAQSLARLTHPNIIGVIDYGDYAGMAYLVMEYLPSGSLRDLVGKPMPPREAARRLLPIARALAAAHQQGIVHCDVNPGNILLTSTGEPMLSDFGIAQALDSSEVENLTRTGTTLGTPEYMAPEQAAGEAVDPRTDVYALGIVLYELLAGRTPFQANTATAVLYRQVNESPPPLSRFVPGLPQRVQNVVSKALAKEPGDRYQMMEAFVVALEALAVGRQDERIPKKTTRQRTAGILAALAALALFFLLAAAIAFMERWQPSNGSVGPQATDTSPPDPIILTLQASDETPSARDTPPSPTIPRNPADQAVLDLVPAGSFRMGSQPEVDPYFWGAEYPQRTVTLDYDYYIYHVEVTNQMYQACVQAGVCLSPARTGSMTRSAYYNDAQYASYPVINVTWEMAQAYCRWAGGRLPSEAEWEKAARGEDGRLFPWGNQPADATRVNYCDRNCPAPEHYQDDDGFADTAPVGSYPANASPYGALDMAGNVLEWVNDWFDPYYYQSAPSLNPPGPESGDRRVARGGSFYQSAAAMRAVGRTPRNPDVPDDVLGFRCVLDVLP